MISERGWAAVSSLICNKTSIMNTYNSNHTLFEHHCNYLPDDLESYLNLNGNKDKVEVARQKILQTHFTGDNDNVSNILDMELEVMPIAIAWIGRPTPIDWEGAQLSGLPLLYELMRRMPDLFDSSVQKNQSAKRKRA